MLETVQPQNESESCDLYLQSHASMAYACGFKKGAKTNIIKQDPIFMNHSNEGI